MPRPPVGPQARPLCTPSHSNIFHPSPPPCTHLRLSPQPAGAQPRQGPPLSPPRCSSRPSLRPLPLPALLPTQCHLLGCPLRLGPGSLCPRQAPALGPSPSPRLLTRPPAPPLLAVPWGPHSGTRSGWGRGPRNGLGAKGGKVGATPSGLRPGGGRHGAPTVTPITCEAGIPQGDLQL